MKPVLRKVVSAIASAGLVATMVVAPSAAVADEGAIVVPSTSNAVVPAGQTINMADYFTCATSDDTQWHVDYVITSTSEAGIATINKHRGQLSTTGQGEVTVTAYLVKAEKGNTSEAICGGAEWVSSAEKVVTIGESIGYGNQGTGGDKGFSIGLLSPAVTSTATYENNGVKTFYNTVADQTRKGTASFTFVQNSGLNQYTNFYKKWKKDSPEAAYKALAGQYISYSDGTTTETLAESTKMSVTKIDTSTNTQTVTIIVSLGEESVGMLHFDRDLHTFNGEDNSQAKKSLGVDIEFSFSLVNATGYLEEPKTDPVILPTIKVENKIGKTFTSKTKAGTFTYKLTGSSTVALVKATKTKKKAVSINTVKKSGKTYKVTAIAKSAFKGAKIKNITLGANVKTVGASAFTGAKSLKSVIVKSKKLTKKSVKKSLKGSAVKTVKVKVSSKKSTNKKYIAKYKKIFTKANSGKKVAVA